MRGLIRALLRSLFAAGILALGFAAYLTVDGLISSPKVADVAIVFGKKVERTGVPSPRLKARLEAAKRLYERKLVRCIFVSGGVGKEGFDESLIMKEYLIEHGIRAKAIQADGSGSNSARTCANARAFMLAHGYRRADLVSQFFHLTRAKLTCRREGIDVVGGLAPRYFEARDIYSLAREVVAVPAYWLRAR
jgi:vancomycin permeability regulator SanA